MEPPNDSVRILHVDDEPDFADMTATFVEREDDRFDIETATSASEGLDRLIRGDFDCVVSDYDMPGQSGIEFLEAVREEYPDLPFILYTGKGSEEVASDAISAGVTDYLQKESGTGQYPVLANRIRNAVEKCHAQTELADREKRLNLFFEESPMGVVEWDENFNFVRLNDTAEDILGYREAELQGESWETIVPESDRDPVGEVVSALMEAEGGHHAINENVRKDGQQISCEWHNRVVTNENNEVITIFSQFQDITDRRRQERRFEAIFNNTHTFVGLMEPDGTLIEVNETALSFGGLDRSDVVGKPLWETYWAQSNDETRATVRDAVEQARGGEVFRDEVRIQGSDQDAIIDFSVRPITDERGEVALLVPEGRDITERKNQEDKRQQIIDRVTDAIVEVNSDWTFTLVNEQAEELYDMTEEDLLGRDFWEVFSGALDTRFEEIYRDVMETREPASFVEHYPGLDGWFDIQVYPQDTGGLAFYFQEVTERIHRSRELEQTRELLEHTEQIADVGGWAIDTDKQDVFWTDHLLEMLGRDDDEEPPLQEALDVYVEADRPRVENAVEEALATGDSFNEEARFERPDGELRWFQVQGDPTVEDGGVVKLRGAVQDITERKERERELEEIEARFQALAENFPNGAVHYFDENLQYQYVAGAGFDSIDTSPADLEGQTIYEAEPYSTEVTETLEPLMQATLAGTEEATEVSYEGHVYELRSVPIRGEAGNIIGGFFITQDVTNQRRWERDLQRQNEELERFASIVSHDLRNPLNVAQGRLELVQAECDSEHLDDVENALERSQTLIDDLLALAREGNQIDDIEAVDIATLIENCWHNVATGEATISVDIDRTVRADRSRLQQFLENLYRNAIEYGDDDVAVTVGALPDGFYIEDDGPGIPADEREDVFDVGYSSTEDGTGFGLSIVQEIADAHGWNIRVTDGSDGGARFEITGVEFTAE
jgi:PAS domain S-box-containing protein